MNEVSQSARLMIRIVSRIAGLITGVLVGREFGV